MTKREIVEHPGPPRDALRSLNIYSRMMTRITRCMTSVTVKSLISI
jgi:hypothetical protein